MQVTPELAISCLAGIRRSFVSIRRVVEVRLDRRGRTAQALGDLADRQALKLAVMARQGDRPATFENPTRSRGLTPCPSRRVTLPRSIGVSVELGASADAPGWTLLPALSGNPMVDVEMLVSRERQDR